MEKFSDIKKRKKNYKKIEKERQRLSVYDKPGVHRDFAKKYRALTEIFCYFKVEMSFPDHAPMSDYIKHVVRNASFQDIDDTGGCFLKAPDYFEQMIQENPIKAWGFVEKEFGIRSESPKEAFDQVRKVLREFVIELEAFRRDGSDNGV